MIILGKPKGLTESLGDSIQLLSLLCSLTVPVQVNTGGDESLLADLKRLLMIDDQITISNDVVKTEHALLYTNLRYSKVFSRYVNVSKICVYGQELITRPHTKKTICFTISNGESKSPNFFKKVKKSKERNLLTLPTSRYQTLDVYEHLFKLALLAGYDPIVLDHHSISLETKLMILNNNCEAVIGYEGGLMHLAHVLQIPTIIFPYHCEASTAPHLLHLDPITYILGYKDNVTTWDHNKLIGLINKLKQASYKFENVSNNVFFGTDVIVDKDTLDVFKGSKQLDTGLDQFQKDFFKKYIAGLYIGGFWPKDS